MTFNMSSGLSELLTYTPNDKLPFKYDSDHSFIAQGTFGPIDRVQSVANPGKVYCRKIISISKEDRKAVKRLLVTEAKVLQAAQHEHVVEFVGAYFYEEDNAKLSFSLIMSYAKNNLQDYLGAQAGQEKLPKKWFGCLISVIAHIHGLGIRHRDIKPENILVSDGKVLLADFGISRMGIGRTIPTTVPQWARSRTVAYCAPEVEAGHTRGRAADIFSLGAVFFEMLLTHTSSWKQYNRLKIEPGSDESKPYAKNTQYVNGIINSMENSQIDGWYKAMFSLCREMLKLNRDDRPLAHDIYSKLMVIITSDTDLQCRRCEAHANAMTKRNQLIAACQKGPKEKVESLLEAGMKANTIGAIHQASASGREDIVKVLRRYDGSVINLIDSGGQTALHYAAGHGNGNLVKYLVDQHADTTVKDDEGETVLHRAAGYGSKEIVGVLLDTSPMPNVEAKDYNGQTPLHIAAKRQRKEVVGVLLARGSGIRIEELHDEEVRIKERDDEGNLPIHLAAGSGSKDIVQALLNQWKITYPETDTRVVVNSLNKKFKTPLHMAAEKGHRDVVKLLLANGSNKDLEDFENKSALQLAIDGKHDSVERLLKPSLLSSIFKRK
jgi:ankyrin repeat protein